MSKKEKDKYAKLLGSRIKSIRNNKGMSLKELGLAADIEKPNIARIEAGNTNPTFYTIVKIALALQIELTELLDIPISQ